MGHIDRTERLQVSHEIKILPVTMLDLNTENPRYEMVANQREAIQTMLADQGAKVLALTTDIVKNGLNPADPIIVAPHPNLPGKYVVLEGNRRVTGLKILINSNLIPEKQKALQKRFAELLATPTSGNLDKVPCLVFEEAEDAYRWVRLKHTGENQGVGVVSWDAQQKARFEERFAGKSSYALQVLDFVKKDSGFADIADKIQKIPSSSLQRLLADPDVRDFLGIAIDEGRVVSNIVPEELRKPLRRIISDLSADGFRVKDIYYKDDRLDYLETFSKHETPDQTNATRRWRIVENNPPTVSARPPKPSKPLSTQRHTLIPRGCILHIRVKRANTIYKELKSLDLREFANAAAVTLRVFVELSLDAYIENAQMSISDGASLNKKVQLVADHLASAKALSQKELKPIRTAVSTENSVLSVHTFNAYVHSIHLSPSEHDLKVAWDNIQPFIQKVWESQA
jgi:hypothetical protein